MKEFYDVDFDLLKTRFKNFLKEDEVFKDYNFEGSAIANLVDLMTYFLQYGTSYLNFTTNELFIQTAQIPDNVYKLAHMLNYIPRRNSSPTITVTITKSTNDDVYIPAYSTFQMGNDVFLTNLDDINLTETNTDIILHEGIFTIEQFASDGTQFQEYELANRETIDNKQFYVFVYPWDGSQNVIDLTEWMSVHSNNFEQGGKNYFIRYFEEMFIRFDDGRLFEIPAENELVVVQYLNTNGALHNGKTGTIVLTSTFTNSNTLSITTNNVLENGSNYESIESIKNNAPLFYSTQNRAVTEKDYNILLKRYSKIDTLKDIYAWSGHREYRSRITNNLIELEENGKRDLGYAYLSALKVDFTYLDDTEINAIDTFLQDYRYLMTFHKFLQPNILFLEPLISLKFKNYLNINEAEIDNYIIAYLDTFVGFNKKFNLSNFIRIVDLLPYIDYIDISYKTFIKVNNNGLHKIVRVWDEIVQGSINGTINGLPFIDSSGEILIDGISVGTVNYATGFIEFEYEYVGTFEFEFEFVDPLSISIQRETFLNYRNVERITL